MSGRPGSLNRTWVEVEAAGTPVRVDLTGERTNARTHLPLYRPPSRRPWNLRAGKSQGLRSKTQSKAEESGHLAPRRPGAPAVHDSTILRASSPTKR